MLLSSKQYLLKNIKKTDNSQIEEFWAFQNSWFLFLSITVDFIAKVSEELLKLI